MVDQVRRRLIRHLSEQNTNSNTDSSDRPPRSPSPSSSEFQAPNEPLQPVSHNERLRISSSVSNFTQLHHPHHPRNYSLPALPINNTEITLLEGDFSIPSYDEAVGGNQSSRISASSSVQSISNIPSESHQMHSRSHSQANEQTTSAEINENASDQHRQNKNLLKILGLNILNARQHLALAICRDCVLMPPLYHAYVCFKTAYYLDQTKIPTAETDRNSILLGQLISPGSSEHFIAGIWCLVAAYLSFAVIDGLVVRWIVTYQTLAAILRVLSMSMLLITVEQATLAIFSPSGTYSLHAWILISCILTGAYIVQNFVTSNLDLKDGNKARSVDYYSITVYAVVPVGLASFVSMIGLLRALLILRLDVENKELGKMTKWIF